MRMVIAIGGWINGHIAYFLDLLGLFILTLRETRHLFNRSRRRIFMVLFKRQLYNTGIKAIYINSLIAFFLGMIVAARVLVYIPQAANYANIYVIVVVRELGPLISGLILISRSATAITAEIGHLKLYDQFDVLHSQRVSAAFIFLLPVFYSFPISLLFMFIYFNFVTMISSWFFLSTFGDSSISMASFMEAILSQITMLEIMITSLKAIIGGSLIGIICIYFGSSVGERFTDISRAISKSTTSLLLMFFVINIGLSILAY